MTGMFTHTRTHAHLWLMLFCSIFLSSDNFTQDPNTADTRLIPSENRNMTHVFEDQPYPYPERFDECRQVLCGENLTGCCYCEAEAVTKYPGVWTVLITDSLAITIIREPSYLPPSSPSNRVGVFLWDSHTSNTMGLYVHFFPLASCHTVMFIYS